MHKKRGSIIPSKCSKLEKVRLITNIHVYVWSCWQEAKCKCLILWESCTCGVLDSRRWTNLACVCGFTLQNFCNCLYILEWVLFGKSDQIKKFIEIMQLEIFTRSPLGPILMVSSWIVSKNLFYMTSVASIFYTILDTYLYSEVNEAFGGCNFKTIQTEIIFIGPSGAPCIIFVKWRHNWWKNMQHN